LFTDPRSIAIDNNGYIYVGDWETGRVQRFDPNGKYLSYWTVPASTGNGPDCLTADRAGNVYACENNALLKYNGASGELLGRYYSPGFGNIDSAAALLNGDVVACKCFGSDDSILKFDSTGSLVAHYDKAISSHEDKSISFIKIAADGLGNVFALDQFNYVVLSFGNEGQFLSRFGSEGHGADQFDLPGAIAVDGQSNIYVSDRGTIKVFDKNWHYLRAIYMPGGVYSIKAMAFDSKDTLYAIGYDKKVYKISVGSGQKSP